LPRSQGKVSSPVPDRELLARAWAVLVDTARAQKTITYSDLAMAVGLPRMQRAIHTIVLAPICSCICRPNNFPDIASLVVRRDTGEPGEGWWPSTGPYRDTRIWRDELESAHAFDWPEAPPFC